MMTPEGKIKRAVKQALKPYEAEADIWMPVPGGFGESRLDFAVCYRGRYIAIETKAPGKDLTARQKQCVARYTRAGAQVFVIDDTDVCIRALEFYMEQLRAAYPSG
ncbi:hypothetical protein [Methylocystis heyeri]|uniref:VRR-NUC domain-containing protein n=1 Tax=Methylocystis heyeri TaxID=391905 RepID=A0A6B8KGM2_9HYPH|nr:hypothetical protein [Methylocystis heyeri]QGM46141.1 hypothetical protein H2LOC_010785 [Methylocystis heyeri]